MPLFLMYEPEYPVPTYLTQERFIFIQRKPDKISFPDNMIFRNKSPVTGVSRIVTVIPHHPVIIHLESIFTVSYTHLDVYKRQLQVIDSYHPDELAIESQFYGKNIQSMLKLGRAQGVALSLIHI